MNVHYDGFHQVSNIREFLFRWETAGSSPKLISVLADISLFAKYHLALQEGPVLCLRKLAAELQAAGVGASQHGFWLTEADVRNFAEAGAARSQHKRRAAQ